MSQSRIKVIEEAFNKMDKSGDEAITIEDLKLVYNVKAHPRYISGEETEESILKRFLNNFEQGGVVDGKVMIKTKLAYIYLFNYIIGYQGRIYELLQCYKRFNR